MQEFSADVKHRMRTRKDAEWWTPTRITYSPFTPQLATRHLWFTFPFSSNELLLPRYLHLDLSKRVMRNVSRLRLHVHALEVEAAAWLASGFCVFNQCPGGHVQNEVQAFLSCRLWAEKILPLFVYTCIFRTSQQLAPVCCNRSTTELFIISFLNTRLSPSFFPELMDLFVAGRDQFSSRSAKQPGWRSLSDQTTVTAKCVKESTHQLIQDW